ncbi:hypothetical protein m02_10250, partial [Bartonella bovis m02]
LFMCCLNGYAGWAFSYNISYKGICSKNELYDC